MAASALRRKACRFRRSKYPADRLRPRRGRCRGGSHRASANVGMMDTEMPMSTAALVMATVIIEPEKPLMLDHLTAADSVQRTQKSMAAFFLASSLRSKSNSYACWRWRWHGAGSNSDPTQARLLTQDPTSATLGGMALAEIQRDRLATRSRVC
jgi:hypothetical protein